MLEVGRDLWKLSCPLPLFKQEHLELVPQGHIQVTFEHIRQWRLYNHSGQHVLMLGHPAW